MKVELDGLVKILVQKYKGQYSVDEIKKKIEEDGANSLDKNISYLGYDTWEIKDSTDSNRRVFNRGYINRGSWDDLSNKMMKDGYSVTYTKVVQTNKSGIWVDYDEDYAKSVGGFKSAYGAKEFLIRNCMVSEIYNENHKKIWSK